MKNLPTPSEITAQKDTVKHPFAGLMLTATPMASQHKPKILIQLDTDPQPSVFDAVVAVDAGVEHLFRHGGVTPANVRDLVYGALFTRGPADLGRRRSSSAARTSRPARRCWTR